MFKSSEEKKGGTLGELPNERIFMMECGVCKFAHLFFSVWKISGSERAVLLSVWSIGSIGQLCYELCVGLRKCTHRHTTVRINFDSIIFTLATSEVICNLRSFRMVHVVLPLPGDYFSEKRLRNSLNPTPLRERTRTFL